MSKQIENMKKMGYSDEEIAAMLQSDREIDRGIPQAWDLTEAEHKKAMKQANATEHKKPATPTKRERKVDEEKGGIMARIVEALSPYVDSMGEVINERELTFVQNAQKYKLTLSKPRK